MKKTKIGMLPHKNHPIVQPCPEGVIDWPFGRLGW